MWVIILAAGVVLAAICFFICFGIRLKGNRKSNKTVPAGTVLLHQRPPSGNVINGSPYSLKLETYLRMAKIPYESDYDATNVSSKGKLPWIEFNGETVADSNFCMRFLNKELKLNLESNLSSTERAIAHCILTTLEENTAWTLLYYRVIDDAARSRELVFGHFPFPLKQITFWLAQRRMKGYLHGQGMGRHTREEIYEIAEKDLRAMAAILGNKKFLLGSNRPSVADAALFGILAGAIWDCPDSPHAKLIKAELTGLEKHTQRMKELYFPDWDEITAATAKKPKSS